MGTTWGQLSERLVKIAKQRRIPITGQFELTSRCNLQCKMCYICQPAKDKMAMERELSADAWIQLAKEARDAGLLYLLLTGGEVFLRNDFKRIYEELAMMGFNIEIYTNATLITPELARWLGRIPPSNIGVTMYGTSPETYARVCGDASGYERAVRGIDLLLSEGIPTWLKTTLVRSNMDDFFKIYEFAEERNMEFGYVKYISPRREGCNTYPEEERLSPRELAEFELQADRYYQEKPKKPKNQTQDECLADEVIGYTNGDNILDENDSSMPCAAGKSGFWVTWDGRMTPCALMDSPSTSVIGKNFGDAWKEIMDLCSSIPFCSDCRKCPIQACCFCCPARLKNETGFFDKSATYLCQLAKERILARKSNFQVYKENQLI